MSRMWEPVEPGAERDAERFGDDPNDPRNRRAQEMSEDDEFIRIGDEYFCKKDLEFQMMKGMIDGR